MSTITERALRRDTFSDLHICDMHCHMGPVYNYHFSGGEIEDMVSDADTVGIERLCVAPHVALFLDYRLGNRQSLNAIQKYPDRVLGMVVVNPNYPEGMTEELEEYYAIDQFVGIKIHPSSHNYKLNGANYEPAFEFAASRGGFVLTHTWIGPHCGPAECEDVFRRYPNVNFIMAHAFGLAEGMKDAIRLVNTYDNAYMDTCGFEFSNVSIEHIMSKVDNDKVFFGSDIPFHDIRGGVGRILYANLSDEIKEKILSKNYGAFLNRSAKK